MSLFQYKFMANASNEPYRDGPLRNVNISILHVICVIIIVNSSYKWNSAIKIENFSCIRRLLSIYVQQFNRNINNYYLLICIMILLQYYLVYLNIFIYI